MVSIVLRTLMEDHKDVMSSLAQGFKECKKHVSDDKIVSAFLDRTLCSRLGIRMLVTHHLLLQENKVSLGDGGLTSIMFAPHLYRRVGLA